MGKTFSLARELIAKSRNDNFIGLDGSLADVTYWHDWPQSYQRGSAKAWGVLQFCQHLLLALSSLKHSPTIPVNPTMQVCHGGPPREAATTASKRQSVGATESLVGS